MTATQTSNQLAQNRIINALGDLYNAERNFESINPHRRAEVKRAIYALEEEYRTLRAAANPRASYATVSAAFKNAGAALQSIIENRQELANAYLSAQKLLGSIGAVLKLLAP